MALALLLSVAASGSVAAGRANAEPRGPSSSFSISGNVNGLFPGEIVPLTLTITDSRRFGIIVQDVSTRVGTQSTTCSAKYVTVSKFSGQLHVAAKHAAQLGVQVAMRHGAPNACQGTVFTFTYTGREIRS
jgi:hypothetical protein